MGSQKMVELLLKYRVKGKLMKGTATSSSSSGASSSSNNKNNNKNTSSVPTTEPIQPSNKRRISESIDRSIQALMTRLNVNLKPEPQNNQQTLCPVDVDVYCDHGTQTALHIAVKNKHFNIASLILGAGSNPNLTIYLNEEELSKLRVRTALDDQYVFTGSTVLVEAVRHRDIGYYNFVY